MRKARANRLIGHKQNISRVVVLFTVTGIAGITDPVEQDCQSGVRSRWRWETGGARERSPLLGLNLSGGASYFGDERLEMRILAEVLQIFVGHQTVGILVPAVDRFLKVLECFVGMVCRFGHTGKVVPRQPAILLPRGIASLFDCFLK